MSRPWIFGIVCCCLLASSASVGWGQDYLDLPEEPSGGGATLVDRFMSLKSKFQRQPSQPKQTRSNSSQRSNPRSPRYRNTSRSSKGQRSQSGQRPLPASQVSSGSVSRPTSNDLLPDTNLFSRASQPRVPSKFQSQPKKLTRAPQRQAKQLSRAASLPRSGSTRVSEKKIPGTKTIPGTKINATAQRVARKSPETSRVNELDAALADLLQTKSTEKKRSSGTKLPLHPLDKPKSVPSEKTFDLRVALLDDENDSSVGEATTADEPTPKPKQVTTVVKKTKPKIARKVAETPVAKREAILAAPAVIAQPVASKPIVIEPTVIEPTVEKPVFEPVPPKQAITIAKPRPSTNFLAVSSPQHSDPKVANDPFEGAPKQVFSTSQQPSNPMRSYQLATEQGQPKKNIARPERGVLHTTQQPVIVSRVEGPRSIMVDREATYQVTLENTSNTPATGLKAEINVPEWAELVDAMSTSGVVKRSDQGANAGALEWKLSELAPHSSQALRLRLIPRSGRPLHLGVSWSHAPVQSQAIIEVQESKLELAISGPQEVRYGKAQRYRLTLRNPGTGLTEQVSLRLIPPGGDAHSATTQKIGDLKPGEVKDIDLELTAREAGELLIQADATARGGLKAETTKKVLCRKPELKVDWRGPEKKYAGTVAAYYFRVRNPGTASTEPIGMSVKLPVGAEFVSASEGYSINTSTGVVSWRLAAIDVSEEQFMQLRCKIDRPGKNNFELTAKTSDGELNDSVAFQTDVVALADLKLEVTDPQGPLPLGESVVYEIRVRNRGTTSAENINVVGLFSEGIDPTTVEGAQFTLRDGRVSFHPIKSLPAGREVLLRIHAKASQAGTHIFRTEVNCSDLDIKLAAEETTRFFEDEYQWEDGQTPYTAERQSTLQR